ncbi:hypothetical protein BKA61DRAFT_733567 [Leptodontidium sp. MPI-SDFR-AT-0119]|nr:hypothetical protein BKA61DRAFT_733567 [Leptodontidium sp. MPI-SDFR-AT-0119]
MKFPLLILLTLYIALINANSQQNPLSIANPTNDAEKVRGHNNATYNQVPKDSQLFSVEFLEIAPNPIKADRVFFMFLRGQMPLSTSAQCSGLRRPTLKISSSAIYPDGTSEPAQSITIPFKTTTFGDDAHLSLRDEEGELVKYLPGGGTVDVVLDCQIPGIFLKTGEWTFEVDARMGDEGDSCLFAFRVVQWLEGEDGRW